MTLRIVIAILIATILALIASGGIFYREYVREDARAEVRFTDDNELLFEDARVHVRIGFHQTAYVYDDKGNRKEDPNGFNPENRQHQEDFKLFCPDLAGEDDPTNLWEGTPLESRLRRNIIVLSGSFQDKDPENSYLCIQNPQTYDLGNGTMLSIETIDWTSTFILTKERGFEDWGLEMVPPLLFAVTGAILGGVASVLIISNNDEDEEVEG